MAILGADGSSTGNKKEHDLCQQLYIPSRTNISQIPLEIASNLFILYFTFVHLSEPIAHELRAIST